MYFKSLLFLIPVLRKSWIGSLVKLIKQTYFPSVCRELTSSAEVCNSGNGRRRHRPNVDLRSHSLARQASILGPLAENSSQVQTFNFTIRENLCTSNSYKARCRIKDNREQKGKGIIRTLDIVPRIFIGLMCGFLLLPVCPYLSNQTHLTHCQHQQGASGGTVGSNAS